MTPSNGEIKTIDQTPRIYFEGYWILYYEPPEDSWGNRKIQIDHLTRRAFHNVEPGINTPGWRLESARQAYEAEDDPGRKRVNAAILAGALFNRATDIFTTIVSLAERGVVVTRKNDLMRDCSRYFSEALELGQQVKHFSGEEGIDEVWGEPFRAFTLNVEEFYTQRYLKLALAMGDIDNIVAAMKTHLADSFDTQVLNPALDALSDFAKKEMETMKSDARYFCIWPGFVNSFEKLYALAPSIEQSDDSQKLLYLQAQKRLHEGLALIRWIAAARVQMPKSRDNYLASIQRA